MKAPCWVLIARSNIRKDTEMILDGYLMGFCLGEVSAGGAVSVGKVASSIDAPARCWYRMRSSRRACLFSMSCMKRAQASTFSHSEAGSALSL